MPPDLLTGRQRRSSWLDRRKGAHDAGPLLPARYACGPSATRHTIDALAVYRLTKLVIDDEIARPLRERLWARFPPEITAIGYLSTCPWCASFWAGLAVAAGHRAAPRLTAIAVEALAASAVTGLMAEHIPDHQ